MKSIRFIFFLIILSQPCFAVAGKKAQQLDSLFAALCAQSQFNGTVLIAEKGKVIFEKGYGYRNEQTKQYNDTRTIFEIGSSTKQFTAAAIVLLHRQGKLQYEDKISKYLPELSFWDKITIYDLLRHTNGLPEYIGDMSREKNYTGIASNADLLRFYAARKDTLEFAPGSGHAYSNTGYVLLAGIIERISGKSYADFLLEHIFKPLKMEHTFVYNRREHPQVIKNYATGYVWATNSFARVIGEDPRCGDSTAYYLDGIVGPAKVNSTVGDLYKWLTALKNNTLFTKEEFEAMTAVTQTSTGRDIPYGFGFNLAKGDHKFSFGHTGNWDGYISLLSHNMIKDRTIIILENFNKGVFPFENISQILDEKPLELKYRKKVVLSEAAMKKYTGAYTDDQDNNEEHILTYLDGHLVYNTKNAAWDMRFYPVGDSEFVALRSNGDNGVIKFSTEADGKVRLEMLQDGEVIGSGKKKETP